MEGREASRVLSCSLWGLPMPWVVGTDICCPVSPAQGWVRALTVKLWVGMKVLRGAFKQRPERRWG